MLRALRDVNIPKFLQDDLPLFENIISDLFPYTERPQSNNEVRTAAHGNHYGVCDSEVDSRFLVLQVALSGCKTFPKAA